MAEKKKERERERKIGGEERESEKVRKSESAKEPAANNTIPRMHHGDGIVSPYGEHAFINVQHKHDLGGRASRQQVRLVLPRSHGPPSSKNRAALFAARTLNPAGQYRVTLSLR